MQLVNEFVVPRPIDQAWDVLTDVERIAPAMPGAQLTDTADGVYRGKVKVKVGPVTAQYGGTAQFKEVDKDAHHMVLEATGKESSGRGRASALVTADLASEGNQTRVKVVTDLTISGPLAQFGRGAIAEVSSKLLGQFVSNLETMVLGGSAPRAGAAPSAAPGTGTESSGAAATSAPSAPAESDGGAAAAGPTAPPSSAGSSPADGTSAGATSAAPTEPSAQEPPSQLRPAEVQGAEVQGAEVNLLKVAAWPILKRLLPLLGAIAVVVVVIVWLTRRR